jgi:hypothetical protein
MAAQQPAAQTGRLRGKAPDIFHGDRSKSETFKQQFKVQWAQKPLQCFAVLEWWRCGA